MWSSQPIFSYLLSYLLHRHQGTETIDTIDQGNNQFILDGQHDDDIDDESVIELTNSNANSFYSVSAVSFGGGKTTITVVEDIPASVTFGDITFGIKTTIDISGKNVYDVEVFAIRAGDKFKVDPFIEIGPTDLIVHFKNPVNASSSLINIISQ